MTKTLAFTRPRQVGYETTDDPPLNPDEVRLKTLFSGISAGTEMSAYRGTSPYMAKQWDPARRLFLPAEDASLRYPCYVGYEEVGEVIEVGAEVADVPLGARVFGTWTHKSHHVLKAADARARRLPDGADPIIGIFSHIGAIALNGVFDGAIRLGETVAVFGLGVLGQIVAQGARQSGARVIAVDLHDSRLEKAKTLGAHVTLNAQRDNPAEAIKDLTGGRGADVCFEVSGSTLALNEAVRAVAYSARVVAMGFFQGEASGLTLGEEFHHNRVNVVCSQISGLAPELTHRWDRLRLVQTAIRLAAEGVLNLPALISHRAPFDEAARLFDLIDQNPDQIMQAVIEFPAQEN